MMAKETFFPWKKKSLLAGWLKKFIQVNFESKGFFISLKLLWIKKIKKKSIKPVEYLKTSRYVIPLPSEDFDKKKIKKKKLPVFHGYLELVYDYYDNFYKQQQGFILAFPTLYYSPTKYKNIIKFSYEIKFEILRVLHRVYGLFSERSFCKFPWSAYYSQKWFKVFSIILFHKMFHLYRNPNLPLRWIKREENFTPKIQGQALLKIWEFIYWQLVFEHLGKTYSFSDYELAIFKQASVNPFDKGFYWWTRRLYLIGLSDHDGHISPIDQKFFFRSFSDIPIGNIDNKALVFLKYCILKQLAHWRDTFCLLLSENKLFFSKHSKFFHSFELTKVLPPVLPAFFPYTLPVIKEFIHLNQTWNNILTFFDVPLPCYFMGTAWTFFNVNYLNFSSIGWSYTKLFKFFDSQPIDAIEFLGLQEELSFLSYMPESEIGPLLLNNFQSIYVESPYDEALAKEIFSSVPGINNEINSEFSVYSLLEYDCLANLPEYLDVREILFLLKKGSSGAKRTRERESCKPLPIFLQVFFFLLLQKWLSFSDIEFFLIKPLLTQLPVFKILEKASQSKVKNFLGPLQVFKEYFSNDSTFKSKWSNPTEAYKSLKAVLKTMPNKDMPVWYLEPFGPNPFYSFNKFLTWFDVPFPDAISNFNYFVYKWKKLKAELAKSWELKFSEEYIFPSVTLHRMDKYIDYGFTKGLAYSSLISYTIIHVWFFNIFFNFSIKKIKRPLYFLRYCLEFSVELPFFNKFEDENQFYEYLLNSVVKPSEDYSIDETSALYYPREILKMLQSDVEFNLLFKKRARWFRWDFFVWKFEEHRENSFIYIILKLLWANVFCWYLSSATIASFWYNIFFFKSNFLGKLNFPNISSRYYYTIYDSSFFEFLKIQYLTAYSTPWNSTFYSLQLKKWQYRI